MAEKFNQAHFFSSDTPPEFESYVIIRYRHDPSYMEMHKMDCPVLKKIRNDFNEFREKFKKELGHYPDFPYHGSGGKLESLIKYADELVKKGEYLEWRKARCCFKQ